MGRKQNSVARDATRRHLVKRMIERSVARREPVTDYQLVNYAIDPPPGYVRDELTYTWHFERIDLRPIFDLESGKDKMVEGLKQTQRFITNVVRGFLEG